MITKSICALAVGALLSVVGRTQSPGNALNFDGSDDIVFMTLPQVFSNIPNNDFTIETWVKPNSSSFQRIMFAQVSANDLVSVTLSNSNEVYFYYDATAGVNTTATLANGVWAHIACTWDASTSTAQIYIDGVLQNTVGAGSSSAGNSNLMALGARTNSAQHFEGEIDELRIWDVVRTPCEIESYMNVEFTSGQNSNLVHYYQFNHGTGGASNTGVITLDDLEGSVDGTLQNFALSGSSSNWVNSGASITLLDVNPALVGTDVQIGCNSFTWIDGNTYTTSNNTATWNLQSVDGCDSTVTLDLTINSVDTSVTQNNNELNANATGATYQWIECPAMTHIAGATSQTYTATANGSYAVIVEENNCSDTSSCFTVTGIGISETSFDSEISVYPNPSSGLLHIDIKELYDQVQIRLTDLNGREVQKALLTNGQKLVLPLEVPTGVYMLIIEAQGKRSTKRIVVNH